VRRGNACGRCCCIRAASTGSILLLRALLLLLLQPGSCDQTGGHVKTGEFGSPRRRDADKHHQASVFAADGSPPVDDLAVAVSENSPDDRVQTARRVGVDDDAGASVALLSPVATSAARVVPAGGTGVVGRPALKRGVCARAWLRGA
jgi:hypothetical protein